MPASNWVTRGQHMRDKMAVSPPRVRPGSSDHPICGKQMCIAGDATQLRPRKEEEDQWEEITTDGCWYSSDSKVISIALDETKRYVDPVMKAGMEALSWGDCASELWLQLHVKAMSNSLDDTKVKHVMGSNEAAMTEWFDNIGPKHAAKHGATVANGKMLVWEDKNASNFNSKSMNKLRSAGGYEKMVFIVGVPFMYHGSQSPDVVEKEPSPLMLSETERATGATLLVPTRFVKIPGTDETMVMCKPMGDESAKEVALERKLLTFGKFGESDYAESLSYPARPFYCVVADCVQGMQFPDGVCIWMKNWWPRAHMLYVAMSRATSSDMVELRGGKDVSQAQWAKYTAVEPRAVLLRAWGGEQPPEHVLQSALQRVRRDIAKRRMLSELFDPRLPYDIDNFVVGGGMKGASSMDTNGRLGLCGKLLTYKQCVTIDVLELGYTVVLLGAAGTGKTTVLTEWAMRLEEKTGQKPWLLLSAASPTHAAGGRLRSDMATAEVNLKVGTVAARYGLGVSNKLLTPKQVAAMAAGLNTFYKQLLCKPYGIIDEAMLITAHRMDVCLELQRRVIVAASLSAGAGVP